MEFVQRLLFESYWLSKCFKSADVTVCRCWVFRITLTVGVSLFTGYIHMPVHCGKWTTSLVMSEIIVDIIKSLIQSHNP